MQTATPGIDPPLFGKGQGVVISTCDLPDGLFQRDPQELVQIPCAQIWKAQLAVQRRTADVQLTCLGNKGSMVRSTANTLCGVHIICQVQMPGILLGVFVVP